MKIFYLTVGGLAIVLLGIVFGGLAFSNDGTKPSNNISKPTKYEYIATDDEGNVIKRFWYEGQYHYYVVPPEGKTNQGNKHTITRVP